MEVMEFKNGCTLTVPDNVTVVFLSSKEGTNNVQGTFRGDVRTVADIVMHAAEKIYNELYDRDKRKFVEAFAEIIQKNPPEGVQVSTVSIRKNATPEEDDE